ncbi:hypothetical protein GALMADRAFT_223891 [Galerina marginata CBS 339.88]|uniref:Arrestin-like N-terminal domain-containing protein n=1 Tax=Galerina marginata (strain CBS 339.88) TaxID=685588 RepID=A0A067T670_GALM3|nr:hypothetical protein GALMADRAFT_223891 [Galerina marginata CBS 339.88]
MSTFSDPRSQVAGRSRLRAFFKRPLSNLLVNPLANTNPVPRNTIIDGSSTPAQDAGVGIHEDISLSAAASEITLVNTIRQRSPTPLTINIPPRYSLLSPRSSAIVTPSCLGNNHDNDLRVSGIKHSFPIRTNKPWATLSTYSPRSVPGLIQDERAKSKDSKLPRFLGSVPMLGTVELDLESSQTIQQISITVRGKIVTGYLVDESYTFLDDKRILWHKSMGSPPSPSAALPSDTQAKAPQGKLSGSYQIPFSFPFPTLFNPKLCAAVSPESASPTALSPKSSDSFDIDWPSPHDECSPVASSSRSPITSFSPRNSWASASRRSTSMDEHAFQMSPTPQSFMEGDIMATVQYELIVHIAHGFLRPDSRIKTSVAYLPCITSSQVSVKRKEASERSNIAPGPLSDPEGWFALPLCAISGELGGAGGQKVSIDCTLYLANPLSYARGTYIPCYLTFSGDDSDSLNILCAPSSPNVRLIRRLRHFSPHGGDEVPDRNVNNRMEQNFDTASAGVNPMYGILPFAAGGSGKGSSLKTVITEAGKATWRVPSWDVPQDSNTRHFEGEIRLSSDLQPTCLCPIFQVEYFVEMLPLATPGFEPIPASDCVEAIDTQTQVLTSHPVHIATLCPPVSSPSVVFTELPEVQRKPML